MTKPRLILVSTLEAAIHYRVATGTIRRWAHEDGWRPYGTRHARQWNLVQVQDSYDRRHVNVERSDTCA